MINIYTYQDLTDIGKDEQKRIDFVYNAIQQHKASKEYETAVIADEYDKQQNTTTVAFQKTIVDITGRIVPDYYSPSHKMCSNFYNRLTMQRVQYSLSNGVKWTGAVVSVPEGTPGAIEKKTYEIVNNKAVENKEWQLSVPTGIKEKLGKNFDTQLQDLCKAGIDGGVSFGFIDVKNHSDHEPETYNMKVFKITEFVPLYDEEDGSLRAGIRWTRVDGFKPLRATLYEEDGFTEYIWNERVENDNHIPKGKVYRAKRPYKLKKAKTGSIDEGEIYNGENYPTFPIVPFFPNKHKQSAIVGMRELIDCYDIIRNEYANEMDNALFFWILTNAGGYDKKEANNFIYQLRQSHVAVLDADQSINPVTVNPQTESRENILDRIERDIYKDYNALDIDQIRAGAVTATQIKAAYESMDRAADQFEYQIIEFLDRVGTVIGIEDTPTFTRSMLMNVNESITTLMQIAAVLPKDYVITKILELLGDGDKAEYIINQLIADELNSFNMGNNQVTNEDENNA